MASSETKSSSKNYFDKRRGAGWVPKRMAEIDRLLLKYDAMIAKLIAERTRLQVNYPLQTLNLLDDMSDYNMKLRDSIMHNLLVVGSIAAKHHPDVNMEELLNKRKLDPFENLNDDWS